MQDENVTDKKKIYIKTDSYWFDQLRFLNYLDHGKFLKKLIQYENYSISSCKRI